MQRNPLLSMDLLGLASLDPSIRNTLSENPIALARKLVIIQRACNESGPMRVKDTLQDGPPVDDCEGLAIITISKNQRADDRFMTYFCMICKNMIMVGGSHGIVGYISLIISLYPVLHTTITANASHIGLKVVPCSIEDAIGPIEEKFQQYDGIIHEPINNELMTRSDIYAVINLHMLMMSKKLTAENMQWLGKRQVAFLRRPSGTDTATYCMTYNPDSWNQIYSYMAGSHNLRAILCDTYVSLSTGLSTHNTTYKTGQNMMQWTECAHLGVITRVMDSVPKSILSSLKKSYSNPITSIEYYRSILERHFPYCKLILTADSCDPINKNAMERLYAFCIGLSGDKSNSNLKISNNATIENELMKIKDAGIKIYNEKLSNLRINLEDIDI